MNISCKKIAIITFFVFGIFTRVQALPSNIIVFGDSLSDIGNIPESTTATLPLEQGGVAINVYVPFSNPVVITNKAAKYTVPATQVQLSYPNLVNNPYLPNQALLYGKTRLYRSMNWSELFLSDLAQIANVPINPLLVPWIALNGSNPPIASVYNKFSVNYAFGGAMSSDSCFNGIYSNEHSECNAQSIFYWQQYYRNDDNQGIMPDIQIPGVLRQIKLFIADVAQHRVEVGPDTLYVIWVGGNDTKHAMNEFQNWHQYSGLIEGLNAITRKVANNVELAVKILAKSGAKHIIVFNLFDVGLTPLAYDHNVLSVSGSEVAEYYNNSLSKRIIDLQTSLPTTTVQLFDAHSVVQQLAKNNIAYHSSLGFACQDQAGYLTSEANIANCEPFEQQPGYLFWDLAHPTFPVHAALAYSLARQIVDTWQ